MAAVEREGMMDMMNSELAMSSVKKKKKGRREFKWGCDTFWKSLAVGLRAIRHGQGP
jgi:hypothetical protein